VQRKVAWIERCLQATAPVHAPPDGPPLWNYAGATAMPACEAAYEGLAVGRMDHHYPLLFVNGVNALGLKRAAEMARALGHASQAQRWDAEATALQQAWQRLFLQAAGAPSALKTALHLARSQPWPPSALKRRLSIRADVQGAAQDDRTYIAALWPTGAAGSEPGLRDALLRHLQARWQARRTADGGYRQPPLWTYFEFAEAHQWLLAGHPEKAWATLEWFFANAESPGLYTAWEGTGDENTSTRWSLVRGWVQPRTVTPHYWAAAEALMLQVAMLAMVDESRSERPLVIGAGVRVDWLTGTLDSGVLSTARGRVQWHWEHGRLSVRLERPEVPLVVAPVFGRSAPTIEKM
jgi:hypothetical protein